MTPSCVWHNLHTYNGSTDVIAHNIKDKQSKYFLFDLLNKWRKEPSVISFP
jgi:hypothetical protein